MSAPARPDIDLIKKAAGFADAVGCRVMDLPVVSKLGL